MVHKSSLIPGLSKFIDENVLAHYPATSIKRIVMAGAVSLYLKKSEGLLETWIHNPLFTGSPTESSVTVGILSQLCVKKRHPSVSKNS